MYRVYRRGRWSEELPAAKNARDNFTVTEDGGVLHLFCQDAQGDIILATLDVGGEKWASRVVLKNQLDRIHSIVLHPIITETGLTIIYNTPGTEDRGSFLSIQNLDAKGQWSKATRLDKFFASGPSLFEVQRVSKNHLILFYQKRGQENNLGYMEITPEQQGNYNIFFTTNYFVSDSSYLTTENGIHLLFVVKSMFSSQLIYRKKMDDEISNPIVLHEAQRIENCLLYFAKGSLYAAFLAAGQLCQCVSLDKGNSFSRPVRYKYKFCQNPEKANFSSQTPQSEDTAFLRQVYVDRACPWDIQIIPDAYEDFFPAPNDGESGREDSASSAELERLNIQLEMLIRKLAEKDQQLQLLANLLKDKTRELESYAYELASKSRSYRDESEEGSFAREEESRNPEKPKAEEVSSDPKRVPDVLAASEAVGESDKEQARQENESLERLKFSPESESFMTKPELEAKSDDVDYSAIYKDYQPVNPQDFMAWADTVARGYNALEQGGAPQPQPMPKRRKSQGGNAEMGGGPEADFSAWAREAAKGYNELEGGMGEARKH
jgi:hypothetical protein